MCSHRTLLAAGEEDSAGDTTSTNIASHRPSQSRSGGHWASRAREPAFTTSEQHLAVAFFSVFGLAGTGYPGPLLSADLSSYQFQKKHCSRLSPLRIPLGSFALSSGDAGP